MRENKKTKCFIIHGFGGGVYEVKPLAEYLNSLGYEVFCPPQVCTNLLEDLKNRSRTHIKRYLGAKKSSPLRAMIQFLRLLHHTKSNLKNINSPILIIQAGDDDTVKRKSADYIYNHICSTNKEVRHIEEGGHLILLSKSANKVMGFIKEFIS